MKKLYLLFALFFFSIHGINTYVYAEENKKAWLGLVITKTEQKEFSTSIMVKEVEAGSPAEKAGIKKGDLINSINKKKNKEPNSFYQGNECIIFRRQS